MARLGRAPSSRAVRGVLAVAACALLVAGLTSSWWAPYGAASSPAAAPSPFGPDGSQTFTSSGTFTDPTGVTSVTVEVIGGGAGGGGGGCGLGENDVPQPAPEPGPNGDSGNAGGGSTFDGLSASGGNPGHYGYGSNDSFEPGGAGGSAPTGGHSGGSGADSTQYGGAAGGSGGASIDDYGAGGSGGSAGGYYASSGGGGSSGGSVSGVLTVVPGDEYTVTVGAAGAGGLAAGSTCTVWIDYGYPYDTGGGGSPGSSGAVLISWTTVPSAPTGLHVTAEPTTTSVSVAWTNPLGTLTANTVEYTGYTDGSCGTYTPTSASVETTYTFTGLTSGTFDCFGVSASNSTGEGPFEVISDVLVGQAAAPTALTESSETHSSVTLTWVNANLGIFSLANTTGFVAAYSGGSCGTYGSAHSLGAVATGTFNALTPGDAYCFEVRDWSPYLAGELATLSDVVLPSDVYPIAPTALHVTAEALVTEISVAWTQPPGTLTGDEVEVAVYSAGSCESFTASAISTATTYTFTDLGSGDFYCLGAAGVNSTGIGAYAVLSPVLSGNPSAPSGLTVTARSATSLKLTWTNPNLGIFSLANVTGFIYPQSGSCHAGTTKSLGAVSSYNFVGLTTGHAFCLIVRSWSPYWSSSVPAPIIADTDPAAPSGLTGTILSYGPINLTAEFAVSWDAPLTEVTNDTVLASSLACSPAQHAFSAGDVQSLTVRAFPVRSGSSGICVEVEAWNGSLNSSPSAALNLPLPDAFYPPGSGSPYLAPLVGAGAVLLVVLGLAAFLRQDGKSGPRAYRKGSRRSRRAGRRK